MVARENSGSDNAHAAAVFGHLRKLKVASPAISPVTQSQILLYLLVCDVCVLVRLGLSCDT